MAILIIRNLLLSRIYGVEIHTRKQAPSSFNPIGCSFTLLHRFDDIHSLIKILKQKKQSKRNVPEMGQL